MKDKLHNMLLRLRSRRTDPRYSFLFPKDMDSNKSAADVFEDLLGVTTQHQMTILDLSGMPSDVLSVVVGVISRLIFEYKYWDPDPTHLPIMLVMEEAHNYLPKDSSSRFSSSNHSVERIAKEGRKYGLSLFVVSQRPSELNETILSQCSNFVALRLTNPADQTYVRKLLPDFLSVTIDMLPYLREGEAVIAGEAVLLPTRVEIRLPSPTPESDGVNYWERWTEGPPTGYSVAKVVDLWRRRDR